MHLAPHSFLAVCQEHTCVLHSIVGWGSTVGRWARVEGTPNDPNPNDPRAHMDSESLFKDGKLLPAITILGMLSRPLDCKKLPQVMAMPCGSICVPIHMCVCVCVFLEQTFTQCLLCVRSCVSHRGHRWAGRGPPHPQMAVAPSSLPLASRPHGFSLVSWSTLQAAASGSLPRCSS